MANLKFYFQNAAPPYSPTTSRGAWDTVLGRVTKKLGTTTSGAQATSSYGTTTNANFDVCLLRAVSGPLAADTYFSGLAAGVIGLEEANAAMNAQIHIHVFVLQGTGDTLRGTLVTDGIDADEAPTTQVGEDFSFALTDLQALAGDTVVVELGYRSNSASTYTGFMDYGTTGADLTKGASSATNAAWITLDTLGKPTITNVAPNAGPLAGISGVVITGTNFSGTTGAAGVKFGANNATSYVVNTNTQITAVAPAGDAGTVDIRVTGPGGTSDIVAADHFTYCAVPTVTAISPALGPVAGGTVVSITGTALLLPSAVAFEHGGDWSDPAASFGSDSSTTAHCTSPSEAAHGSVWANIRVTTPGGTSATSGNNLFLFQRAAANLFTQDDHAASPLHNNLSDPSGWGIETTYTYVPGPSFSVAGIYSEVDLMGFLSVLTTVQADTDFLHRWTHNRMLKTVGGGGVITYTLRNDDDSGDYCHWAYDPATGVRTAIVFD